MLVGGFVSGLDQPSGVVEGVKDIADGAIVAGAGPVDGANRKPGFRKLAGIDFDAHGGGFLSIALSDGLTAPAQHGIDRVVVRVLMNIPLIHDLHPRPG